MPLGFEIRDSNECYYPLYLLTEPPLEPRTNATSAMSQATQEASMARYIEAKAKHVIQFEQGVVLLDQAIEYLRFNFRG